jgi:heptosyltransferase-2/heptosyltransferase-3
MLTDAIASEYEALHAQPGRGGNPPVHLPQLYNLAGRTADLHQLVWVLQHAHIVLGVDSGPLHIAAALHKPTLHLYGPSDEAIWGPWGDPRLHRTLRAPGTRPTMKLDTGAPALQGGPDMQAITVDMVMAAIRELMGECERMMPDGPDG